MRTFHFQPIEEYTEELQLDRAAEEHMKNQMRFDGLKPLSTEQDGNCLFHSISRLGRLNERSLLELRVRSLVQVIINYDKYMARYLNLRLRMPQTIY